MIQVGQEAQLARVLGVLQHVVELVGERIQREGLVQILYQLRVAHVASVAWQKFEVLPSLDGVQLRIYKVLELLLRLLQ